MKIPLDKKPLVSLGVFLIIFLIFGFFVIYPLFTKIRESSNQLFLIKKDSILIEERNKQKMISEQKLSQLTPELEKIKNIFVDEETPVDFLLFLEKTAEEHQVLIDISLLSGTKKETLSFSSLNFKLSLEGSFSNCLQFLSKIETSSYLIEIENLSATRLRGIDPELGIFSNNVDLDLSIKVFTNSLIKFL